MHRTKLYIALAATLTIIVALFNYRLRAVEPQAYAPGKTGPDVIAQLDGLSEALDEGAGESMQELFPEGYMFTWALYGLSWVQVGMNEPPQSPLHERAVAEARRAVAAIDSTAGRDRFVEDMDPAWGAFYNGWLTWLRGGALSITEQPDAAEVQAFEKQCDRIADAFRNSDTPFLESYPNASWPADSVIAASALRLHDHLFEPRYEAVLARWSEQVRDRMDPQTGLIAHRSASETGSSIIMARGSSQALMLRFLIDLDPQLAREHYPIYRDKFAASFAGMLPGVREYPKGIDGPGDVDSGPVVFGYSGPASVVGMGTALSFGDRELAEPLLRGAEFVGAPYTWDEEKRYGLGTLPVGEAFLVWSNTAQPWISEVPEEMGGEAIIGEGWVWRWHVVSGVVVLLGWLPVFTRWRRRREKLALP
jgi:hypothetical protein